MAMLTVYKKIFQHLLSSNYGDAFNFKLMRHYHYLNSYVLQPIQMGLN